MNLAQDQSYLKNEQYKTPANLTVRADIHRRFSTAVSNWHKVVFETLALQPGYAVLECGCGPGWIWRNNLDAIPANCQITLTDLSAGMVSEAEQALTDSGIQVEAKVADIQDLPFEDEHFDVVVANHMLYHVPDLEAGLKEVRRVLKPGGRFVAATNGLAHMQEAKDLRAKIVADMGRDEGEFGMWPVLSFRLENGKELLKPWFSKVSLLNHPDSLQVTETEPLVDYLLSTIRLAEDDEAKLRENLRREISAHINKRGAYSISKATGLFIAQK